MTIILANNMSQGETVMNACGMKEDDCAIITEPDYLDEVRFFANETVYAHNNVSPELVSKFTAKINLMPDSNLKLVFKS
jgi:hypothetical protein